MPQGREDGGKTAQDAASDGRGKKKSAKNKNKFSPARVAEKEDCRSDNTNLGSLTPIFNFGKMAG